MCRTIIATLIATAVRAGAAPAQDLALTGARQQVIIGAGESLATLSARYGVDAATLAALNNRRPDARLAIGESWTIDNRHLVPPDLAEVPLVVNVPQRMLFLRDADGVRGMPVAVGKASWRTPLGPFTIVEREQDPTWDVPESILAEAARNGKPLPPHVPPGPDNPLGAYWLRLSLGSVGIHGTNAPASIYRVTTHGCMRLHPDDIAWLFPRVPLGMAGRVISTPVLFGVVDGVIYVEAHRDAYHLGGETLASLQARAAAVGLADVVAWDAVRQVLDRRDGIAHDVGRVR